MELPRRRARATVLGALLVPLALLVVAETAHGGLVVDWGGDYVEADLDSPRETAGGGLPFDSNDNNDEGLRSSYPLRLDVPLSPDVGGDYGGPSARFYGGHATAWAGGSSWYQGIMQLVRVRDGGAADWIELGATNYQDGDHYLASYLAWRKEDFLGGADAATVGFGPASKVRLDRLAVRFRAFGGTGYQELRWFVETDDGGRYVSQDVTGADDLAAGLWAMDDFSGLAWAGFPLPDNDLRWMYINNGDYSTPSEALDDLAAVGFLVQGYGTAGSCAGRDLRYYQVSGFKAWAAPEPGTLVLLAAGAVLTAIARRRGRRRA